MLGVERGSGVGLAAVVGGVALAGTAFAGALAHVCSKKRGWSIARTGTIPAIMAYKEVGGPPGRAKPRTTAISRKSGQTDDDRCNRHAAFTNEIA